MKIAARPVTAVAAGRGKAACGVFLVLMCLAAVGVVPAAASAARGPRFSAPVFVNTGAATETLFAKGLSVLAADVNGDDNPDLVAATSRGVCVLYGNGDGTFRRRTYRVRDPVDVAVGDVTGDDRADLIAVGSHGLDGFVVTFVNNGAGRFHRGSMYTMKGDAISVAAGDFNGDGISDVVVDGLFGEFSVLMATGNGQLAPPHTIPGTGGRDLTVGDLNGDGRLDVALAALDSRAARVRLGAGDGTFGAVARFGAANDDAVIVSTADLNADGKLDLVVGRQPGRIEVLLGNGDGTFAGKGIAVGGYGAVEIGDFDGDGIADIADTGAPIGLRLGAGDGSFQRRQELSAFSRFTSRVEEDASQSNGAVADFNRDGRIDIAVAAIDPLREGQESVEQGEPGWIAVLLNRTGLGTETCVVTPVRHETLRAARRYLTHAGCRIGRVRYRSSRHTRRGRVISQRPSYGAVRPAGTKVRLVVSRGRRH